MATLADPQNERKVSFGASGGAVRHHDLLRAPAVGQWFALRSETTSQWKQSEDRSSRGRLADLSGCLEKLESTLLQGKRLRSYHDALITDARSLRGTNIQSTARQGSDACADFEAFVLQARSALDRLTWFIGHVFKDPCQSFRRLKNVLAGFAGSYAEFSAAQQLARVFPPSKGYSLYVPLSRQEKGVDLILARRVRGSTHATTIQVESSRTYSRQTPTERTFRPFRYYTWFNRFEAPPAADYVLLVAVYPPEGLGRLAGRPHSGPRHHGLQPQLDP